MDNYKNNKALFVFFFLVNALLVISMPVYAQEVSISGIISLPSGSAAPSGGLQVNLNAFSDVSGQSGSASVSIGAGQSSVSYSINVPPSASEQWRVSYYCSDCDGYVEQGYYTSTGTEAEQNSADLLTGGQNHTNIDLQLVVANSISGTISLPSGTVAPSGGLQVNLNAFSDVSGQSGSASVSIGAGQSSAIYSINVPSSASEQWRVSYSCFGCDGYVEQAYYSSTSTEVDYNSADLLTGGQNHTNIDLQLVVANSISGTISLPSGTVAPSGGLQVNLNAFSDVSGQSGSASVSIGAGQSSAIYSINVPSSASEQWRVSYSCFGCDGYVEQAYYSSTSTEVDYNSADLLTGGQNHTNIDLQLVVANSISGTISLPSGTVAPSGGLQVNLNAFSDVSGQSGSASVSIGAGQSSAIYSINVPSSASEQWRVSYSCFGCDGYVEQAYYSSTSTEVDYNSADLLTGGQNHTNIDLQLVVANSISGTISLPSGTVAPSAGLQLYLNASSDISGLYASASVSIDAGQSSVSYSINVPPSASEQWRVSYYCSDCDGYVEQGYYTSTGTEAEQNSADLLTGGQNHTNIDLQLVVANSISGTISLPSGTVAPSAGLQLYLNASSDISGLYASASVSIDAGQSSVSYSINVPPSASEQWRVSYYCSDCDGYVEQGYYTSTGTEAEQNSADLLTGGQNHTNIDLQLVVANSISGTISLPSGTVAPSGGLQVELNASGELCIIATSRAF